MSALRVHQFINDPQYISTKEGQSMDSAIAESILLRTLIREHAKHRRGSYSLFFSDLPRADQVLLLSYQIEADELEWAYGSPFRLDALLDEFEPDIQKAIDNVIDEIYHEDMQEMGLSLCHHNDNNEHFYYKR